MKSIVQVILQKILGFKSYLWVFTRFKLRRLHRDESEKDFFHFLELIPENSVVLDIGANLGLMSYYLAREGKINKVLAFEPIPHNLENLKRLKDHYKLNTLEIHPVALGNETKEIEMVLPVVKGVKKQGLGHVMDEKMESFNEGIKMNVPCYTLDDYLIDKTNELHAIKIDVENFEYEVFQGSQSLLEQHKPLIYCELWENQNRKDCFEFLQNLGYKIMYLSGGSLRPFPGSGSQTQNFFFIPNTD